MKKISNYIHDVERFGFTPNQIIDRVFNDRSELPKILTVSVPKSGTNLLQRILTLHPRLHRALLPTLGNRNKKLWETWNNVFPKISSGQICSTHLDFNLEIADYLVNKLGFRIIFVIRDPRDIVVSDMYYIEKRPDHGYYSELGSMGSEKDRLTALIAGTSQIRPIVDQMARFIGWQKYASTTVKYEDMVGLGGGGDSEVQINTISRIYEDLNIPINSALLNSIAGASRSEKSQTFRKGTIGNWKEHFDEELNATFKASTGNLLFDLGYESSEDW